MLLPKPTWHSARLPRSVKPILWAQALGSTRLNKWLEMPLLCLFCHQNSLELSGINPPHVSVSVSVPISHRPEQIGSWWWEWVPDISCILPQPASWGRWGQRCDCFKAQAQFGNEKIKNLYAWGMQRTIDPPGWKYRNGVMLPKAKNAGACIMYLFNKWSLGAQQRTSP